MVDVDPLELKSGAGGVWSNGNLDLSVSRNVDKLGPQRCSQEARRVGTNFPEKLLRDLGGALQEKDATPTLLAC